jgi:starch-binding outer membrane protein, SusD/RagB family
MKIHRTGTWLRSAAAGAALVGLLGTAACDNFIAPPEGDPNAVPNATLDQLATAIQVSTFFFSQSQMARLSAMWTQQMAGTDRQFTILDGYVMQEEEGNTIWNRVYLGGGIPDIRRAIDLAVEQDRRAYAGVLRIHEAYLVGMAASIWGDVPYSEAGNVAEFFTPALDPQAEVYAAVQSLLDAAIADLQTGQGPPAASVDLNFRGNTAQWIAVANSLKARFHMHMATANPAGSADRYTAARAAAQNGIRSAAGNWRAVHSDATVEQNVWAQFLRERDGYLSAGRFMVEALRERGDPRLQLYYSRDASGNFVGAPPASTGDQFSKLNLPGSTSYPQPILTCAETEFIIAEASYRLNDLPEAVAALQRGVACNAAWLEARSGQAVVIPIAINLATAAPAAVFAEIMTQKYFANFLNMEVWNDYKRTCLPAITPYSNLQVPRRMFYPASERQNNRNIPEPGADPGFNPNDGPKGC